MIDVGREAARRDGQIEQGVALGVPAFGAVQERAADRVVGAGIVERPGDVAYPIGEPTPRVPQGLALGGLRQLVLEAFAKAGVVHRSAGDADQREAVGQQSTLPQMAERRYEQALR
jgi:hypothetical protein